VTRRCPGAGTHDGAAGGPLPTAQTPTATEVKAGANVVDQSGATAAPSGNENGAPPLSFQLEGLGYDKTYTFRVRTRTQLKIRFTPGEQNKTVAGTGFSPQYQSLAVFMKVGSNEQPTSLVALGSHHTLEFSNSFTKTCASTNTTCRQTVTITVSKPNYDYWCSNYGQYCPHTHVYPSHPWNGRIEVQTDDTAGF
jgi:hypothetical protein